MPSVRLNMGTGMGTQRVLMYRIAGPGYVIPKPDMPSWPNGDAGGVRVQPITFIQSCLMNGFGK